MQISTLVFRKTLEQRERQIVNQCCVPTQSSLKTRETKCNDTTAAGVGSFVIRPTACEPNIAILPFLVPISDSVPFQVVSRWTVHSDNEETLNWFIGEGFYVWQKLNFSCGRCIPMPRISKVVREIDIFGFSEKVQHIGHVGHALLLGEVEGGG